jgi:demethylmenaquinone methyltransferase/2-methoxy-6-polyprenyl-1,4-benzoquinol methylase
MSFRNPFYIENLFDHVSARYDIMNTIMSFGLEKKWKNQAVQKLFDLDSYDVALDLAGGTGAFSSRIKNNVKEVHLADLSESMISIAKKNDVAHFYHKTNAENLPFDDRFFDLVICAFGLRNFSNPIISLREVFRVLKPGGRFLLLELCEPENLACCLVHNIHCRFLPFIGKIVANNSSAYSYLTKSVANFPSRAVVCDLLSEVGFCIESSSLHKFGCMEIIAKR